MLNQDELYRGMADAFVKNAVMYLDSRTAGAPAIRQSAENGSFWGGLLGHGLAFGADHVTRNPGPTSSGFMNGLRQGFQKRYTGSQGQIDLGNNILNQSTGGALQLDQNNQAHINFGNAIKHFGGQAVDWIKNNPGTAALGGGALLGGGLLLHHALSGNNEPKAPEPDIQVNPERRFAFAKPGITG